MKLVTMRRLIQQTGHCVAEALSAAENQEDPRHVVADLEQAALLIQQVLKTYRSMAKGAERGDTE